MDTSHKGNTGEQATALALQRAGFLVAKPCFDQRGADLLAFIHIAGGAKFARVQCKYRQPNSSIEIPAYHVPGAFICFLLLVPPAPEDAGMDHWLYAFFSQEIKAAWNHRKDKYVLPIPSLVPAREQFLPNLVSADIFERMRELIKSSKIADEMGMLDFSNPNNSGLL
jgi:hypothetical protein